MNFANSKNPYLLRFREKSIFVKKKFFNTFFAGMNITGGTNQSGIRSPNSVANRRSQLRIANGRPDTEEVTRERRLFYFFQLLMNFIFFYFRSRIFY